MPNEQNLKKLTTKKAREIGRKGGVKSGETRRQKRDMKQAMKMILNLPVSDNNKAILESLGLPETEANNQMLMLAVTMQKALKGDMRAIEYITNLTTVNATDKAKHDIEKKRIKLEQEKIRPHEVEEDEKVVIVNDLQDN